jgi:uridylate kinase
MHIFDVAALGAMSAICQGEDIGTVITADNPELGG